MISVTAFAGSSNGQMFSGMSPEVVVLVTSLGAKRTEFNAGKRARGPDKLGQAGSLRYRFIPHLQVANRHLCNSVQTLRNFIGGTRVNSSFRSGSPFRVFFAFVFLPFPFHVLVVGQLAGSAGDQGCRDLGFWQNIQ